VRSPLVKKVVESSKVKRAHLIHVRHRDQVESPITDWLREAYEFEPIKKKTPAMPTSARKLPKKAKKKPRKA
jgi:hypothetical protein